MARIAGVDLPNDKRVEIALTYICGIGRTSASDIIRETGINPDTRVKDLSEDEVAKIRDRIENHYTVEGDLKREVALNISTSSAAIGMRFLKRSIIFVSRLRLTLVPLMTSSNCS